MRSNITGGPTVPKFQAKVLGKYEVTYYECCETGFIQTEAPYWLDEAYSSAITALDLGLVSRNFQKSELTCDVLERAFLGAKRFIDYGGGYGMFTRLMRDKGFDFVHYDTHCENLFASGFEVSTLETSSSRSFELLTAWEVFEHLESPRQSLEEMLDVSNAILFSTELIPKKEIRRHEDWWYFAPETGQHISFYTTNALRFVANELALHLYTDGFCNHIFSKVPLRRDPFLPIPRLAFRDRVVRRFLPQRLVERLFLRLVPGPKTEDYLERLYPKRGSRTSLLAADFENALKLLRRVE